MMARNGRFQNLECVRRRPPDGDPMAAQLERRGWQTFGDDDQLSHKALLLSNFVAVGDFLLGFADNRCNGLKFVATVQIYEFDPHGVTSSLADRLHKGADHL